MLFSVITFLTLFLISCLRFVSAAEMPGECVQLASSTLHMHEEYKYMLYVICDILTIHLSEVLAG